MTEKSDLEVVFERAILARVSGFDLIGEDGMKALCEEIPADFPYLTVADLNATIKLGIKGKLDTYKNRPLNFTRVYQWVEQRAPYSLGYWQTKFPELLRWAELCKVLDTLLPKLQAFYAEFGDKAIEYTVTEHIGLTRYPLHHKGFGFVGDEEVKAYEYIKHHLFPIFAAEYPAYAAKHPNLFNPPKP